jgi:hypothetical protein
MKQGRLRQGWAPPGSSLTEDGARVNVQTWKHRYVEGARRGWKVSDTDDIISPAKVDTRHRILSQLLVLQRGDVVLVPRMPSDQEMTVAPVTGSYTFDDRHYATIHHDMGHVVPIDAGAMRTYGYNQSDGTRRISGMFQHYRSAVTPVRNEAIRQLILELAP